MPRIAQQRKRLRPDSASKLNNGKSQNQKKRDGEWIALRVLMVI